MPSKAQVGTQGGGHRNDAYPKFVKTTDLHKWNNRSVNYYMKTTILFDLN